ncbi:MAG TPA: alpha/beta hydrolase [Amaricoccus sp.]|nr:alpha/beta hydrolase [Amaricoccus sp.]
MAYLGVRATERGLVASESGVPLREALARRLGGNGTGPVAVLVHGYKFHPERRRLDPEESLFAPTPRGEGARVRSWPAGLGFRDDGGETGLAIGFGWPADAPLFRSLLATGRNGFARVYAAAAESGAMLAELVTRVQALAPGRPVDVLAHSLGARVALAALPHLAVAPGRVVLLGAAEYEAEARRCLAAVRGARAPQVYNITTRANDVYDLAFECFAPRPAGAGRALGAGLAGAPESWLDLQLDHPAVTAWINGQGIALSPPEARVCHWSFYTRPGALSVYAAILRRRPGWDVAELRRVRCLGEQEPRWSRLLPRRGRGVVGAGLGSGLGHA